MDFQVDDEEPERRQAIRGALLRYLREHPRAADTAAGICTWWLAEDGVNEVGDLVEHVLEALVAEGVMRRIGLRDGTQIYAGTQADGPEV